MWFAKSNLIANGYDVTNFSKDLPKFHKSLGNTHEQNIFLYESTIDDIINHFKNVTK